MNDFCALYLCDRGLHDETILSIASLAKHSAAALHIRFFQVGYADYVPDSLRSYLTARGHRLTTSRFDDLADHGQYSTNRDGITPTTLMKFAALQSLVNDHDWIHYVDGDTLFFKDPHFERTRGFAQPIAACLDQAESNAFWNPNFHQNCRASGRSPDYFNAGLMSINAAAWRGGNYVDHFESIKGKQDQPCPYHPEDCHSMDQCPTNQVFSGNWHPLPLKLNVQRCALHTSLWADATMRHYTQGRHKCLPIMRRRCDRKEHRLLNELAPICGLSTGLGFYDGGLSYYLNRLRRYRAVKAVEQFVAEAEPQRSRRIQVGVRRPSQAMKERE